MRYKRTTIPLRDVQDIFRGYGITVEYSPQPLLKGADNINLLAVTAHQKKFVLKVCAASKEDVLKCLDIIQSVGSTAQQPMKTLEGQRFFEHRGIVGYVLPFVEGEDFLEQTINQIHIQEIAAFYSSTVRKLSSLTISPTPNIWNLSYFYSQLPKLQNHVSEFGLSVPDIDFQYLGEKQLSHNDFTRSNVLYKADGQLHLLDYGDCSENYFLCDLAIAAVHFCVESTPVPNILPQLKRFLSAVDPWVNSQKNLALLYQLMCLRCVQALVAMRHENEILGIHPRSNYWLDFGLTNYRKLGEISAEFFVESLL